MNIKEAGRYSNFINSMISNLRYLIYQDCNIYNIVENHLKTKSNPDAKDEVIILDEDKKMPCKMNDLVHLINSLIAEKNQLALAIEKGKSSLVLDWKENGINLTLDAAIEYNKNLRDFAGNIKALTTVKNSSTKKQATDRKFNVEGNQVNYTYEVEVNKTIDFDRTVINELYKKTLDKTDMISTQIDNVQLKDVIVFTPNYSIYDTTEDVIEKYMSKKD